MSAQYERVTELGERIVAWDVARRRAVEAGHGRYANRLANLVRETIAATPPDDLRSLVTLWALRQGAAIAAPHVDQST